jgi:hypothetical protein
MAGLDDQLRRYEALFGAISKIKPDTADPDMLDARCPRCRASSFVSVADLYMDTAANIQASSQSTANPRVAGLTDEQILTKFRPPRRRSPAPTVMVLALLLAVIDYYLYTRFGDTIGQFAIIVAIVIVVAVSLTTIRKASDEFYRDRKRWRSLFVCRECGQLVAP